MAPNESVEKPSFLVGAWMPTKIVNQLQELANKNHRSRGGELRMAVKHWLAQPENQALLKSEKQEP